MLWMPDTNVWINIIKRPGGHEEAVVLGGWIDFAQESF